MGTAVEARFINNDKSEVQFVLDEVDPIRGDPPPMIELTTRIGNYNPSITIGEKYLAYVSPDDQNVSYCQGFAQYSPEVYFTVLLSRKKGDCGERLDREIAVTVFLREYEKYGKQLTRPEFEAFLNDFIQVAPSLTYQTDHEAIIIKGIQLVFDGEALATVNHVGCSEVQ